VDQDWMTIAEAAARCGLPESTLRYWERIGLVNRVQRDASSGHRRYRPEDVATLETLGHLRAVGLSIEDMRAYLAGADRRRHPGHDRKPGRLGSPARPARARLRRPAGP
jgi:DNA-binding transcriptional MerR regulator